MGWTYMTRRDFDRTAMIKHIKSESFWAPATPIKQRVVGNNVWTLYQHNGRKAIELTLIASGGTDCGYGYKRIDEADGPNEVNCPQSLIDQADAPRPPHANIWREQVKAFHALKAATPEPETGMRVVYDGIDYRLHSPAGKSLGWYVVRCDDGALQRMKGHQLARALEDTISTKD